MSFQLSKLVTRFSGHTLLTSGFVAALGLALAVWSGWPRLRGPITTSAGDWSKLESRTYVKVKAPRVVAGFEQQRDYKLARFAFLTDGKHVIAVRFHPDIPDGTEAVGFTDEPDPSIKARLEDAQKKNSSLADLPLAPVLIDTLDEPAGAVPFGGVIFLIGAAFALRSALELINPRRHPVYKRLARIGPADQVEQALDQEMNQQGEDVRSGPISMGPLVISPNWLVDARARLNLVAFQDLAWIYLHETQQSVNGLPAGTVRKLMCWHLDGKKVVVGVNESAAMEILHYVSQVAPWVQVGFSDDLDKQWKKRRKEFVAKVQSERGIS